MSVLTLPASTTTLEVTWLPVIEEDRKGIILGHRVALSNSSGEFMRNITVVGSTNLKATMGDLEIWTNYTVQVCAYNSKGNGPWSMPVIGNTDEEGTLSVFKSG